VTEDDLLERGLFTFDLQPNLMKELYVRETRRGIGIGHALMAAVLASAK